MYALAIQKAGIFAVVGNAPRSRGKDVPGRRVIVVCANVAVRPEHLPYVFRQIQFVRAQNRPVRFENAGTSSGSAVPANPLQWSSEIYDSELDLVYYNYRHYSPALGRFLSRDPIEEQGGLNLYAFVGNQIWSKIDYLGRDIWVENTEAVFGLHQRVCVDQWVKSFRVDCEKTCCHNGIPYVRAGKFCISFGAKNPSDFAYISGDSGGLPPSSPNANNDCGLPPDFGPVVPGGTGVVYPDMDDKKEAESHRHSTGCGRDISSQKYMERLIGLESEYILFRRNCRTFSQAVLEHLVSMGEKYA